MGHIVEKLEKTIWRLSQVIEDENENDEVRAYRLEYSGVAKFLMRQEGSAWKIKHPVDNRECFYEVWGVVRENFYAVFSNGKEELLLSRGVTGDRESKQTHHGAVGQQFLGQHTKCSDLVGAYERDKNKILAFLEEQKAKFSDQSHLASEDFVNELLDLVAAEEIKEKERLAKIPRRYIPPHVNGGDWSTGPIYFDP